MRSVTQAFCIAAALIVAGTSGGSAKSVRQTSDILFNHSLHINQIGLDCGFCHQAAESHEARDQLLPSEALCLTCHDGERAGGACQLCHRSADAPVGYPPERRTVIFSHKQHLDIEAVTCASCHDKISEATESQPGLPEMSACLGCHDGVRQSIECATCHTNPEQVTREIHPPGWENDHRIAASLNDPDCDACHRTDNRCSLCHQGDNLRGRIHPFNWVSLHGVESRGRTVDCTACHDTQQFCVSCHTGRAVKPTDHLSPDWIDRHGEEARFDLETCDACHGGAGAGCAGSGCHDR